MALEELPPDSPPVEPLAGQLAANAEDRQWGMFAHLSALAGLFAAGMTFIGPLVVWLIKKDQSKFVDDQGKEALNFHLNVLLYTIVLVVISFATCGFGLFVTAPLLGALAIYAIVMPIVAGLAANRGELYRYPLTFRVIK
jgi:uncharacterized protein